MSLLTIPELQNKKIPMTVSKIFVKNDILEHFSTFFRKWTKTWTFNSMIVLLWKWRQVRETNAFYWA